ncbi:universal stress protein [Halobacteria archaeon AArc-m2/3/4]|uniref:Universal stress protein n=1 Tax=Natronoglomus mannanivorans TaxID=2979990 RepID=A0ABT2QF98_9EURY|nr:universal stress protein [Halobacteria archaeon AArc-m2/3/4]
MKNGLVVLEDTEGHRDLLREAVDYAAGTDAELYVLSLVSTDEFDEAIETLDAIRSVEDSSYRSDAILTAARNDAEEIANDVLADFDDGVRDEVTISAIAAVFEEGARADTILEVAADTDCDHVFIVGQNRSPTGKVIFGNVAQQVILNFEGYVTMTTE